MDLYISTESNNPYQLPDLLSNSDADASTSYNSMLVANANVAEGHLSTPPDAVEAPIPHSNNLKDRICQICYLFFKTPTNLQDHYRIHSKGKKQFACTECSFPTNSKRDFNKHMKEHFTGFACTVCNKPFARKGDLTRHILIHTGEKPFKCTVCNDTFRQKEALTKHSRIHTGEKPFKCTVCNDTFRQKETLTRHNLIHTGERPFKCKVCLKAFNQSRYLKRHNRTHTGEKPFKCTFCPKAYIQNRDLTRHIQSIHTSKTNSAASMNPPVEYQNNNESISKKTDDLDILYSLDRAKVAEIKESLEKELANFNSLETNSAVNINPSMEYQSNNDNATRLQQEISYPMDFNFYDLPSNFNLDDTDENM